MDETSIDSKKHFKVLCEDGRLPISCKYTHPPHMTACCCFNAAGTTFRPFIILPSKKTTSGIEEFTGVANFGSTASGWMTKNMFTIWVFFFLSELSLYRLSLPENLRHEKVLLILDGHLSRANLSAMWLLYLFDVEALIIPGHTSHVLQAFDLTIASPLKTYLSQIINELSLPSFEELMDGRIDIPKKKVAKETRKMFIQAFIDAFRKSATISNIKSGFEKAGMVPLQPWIPMSNEHVSPANPELYGDIRSLITIGSSVLSDEKQLQILSVSERKKRITNANCPTINSIVSRIKLSPIKDGIPLTTLPDLFNIDGTSVTIYSLY
jgi:hypothetical protein